MKKKTLMLLALGILFILGVACSSTKVPNKDELTKTVNKKIDSMQNLIGFSNQQATKLKKIELEYLKQVKNIKKNTKIDAESINKKILKLKDEHMDKIKNILSREQYLKYDAIENDRIKNGELRAN